jgi:SAM-dependent methyltransferase
MHEHRDLTADNWDDIARWWLDEIRDDQIYASDVHPLFRSLVGHRDGVVLDLGCGNGQGAGLYDGTVIGVDLSLELLRIAAAEMSVIRARLPSLRTFRANVFDHAGAIYLLDLIEDDRGLFTETRRVVRPGGTLSIVMNHPVYTAPDSAPIADADGEVLWRWGGYQTIGSSFEEAGHRMVEFFHRPMDVLLSTAADCGWILDHIEERPLSREAIESEPGYVGQDGIPRLLGVRWRLPEGS